MSMYPVKDLVALWSQEQLTIEQALGQLLQHLLAVVNRLGQLEKRLQALEQQKPNVPS